MLSVGNYVKCGRAVVDRSSSTLITFSLLLCGRGGKTKVVKMERVLLAVPMNSGLAIVFGYVIPRPGLVSDNFSASQGVHPPGRNFAKGKASLSREL